MTFLIVHGYYLQGAGSNFFVYHTCKSLVELGHDVILVCQETSVWDYDIITEVWDYSSDQNQFILTLKRDQNHNGRCMLYRPFIGKNLPVFTYEDHKPFISRELCYMSDQDIAMYVKYNVHALEDILQHHSIDVLWAHHCLLQPYIVSSVTMIPESCYRIATIHGNAIQCIQKKKTLIRYAVEGLKSFHHICFTSPEIQKEFMSLFQEIVLQDKNEDLTQWESRMSIIFPGIDTDLFHPIERETSKAHVLEEVLQLTKSQTQIGPTILNEDHYWDTDVLEIFRLSTINTQNHPMILFFGRYSWTKGIQMLAIAIPLILQKHPNARFVFTGFGPTQTYAETLISYLHHGRKELFLESIQNPDLWDAQIEHYTTTYLRSFLHWMEDPAFRDHYFQAAKNEIQKAVYFTGYVDQPIISKLIRCADVAVFPFLIPESFGGVTLESLGSGVIPLISDQCAFVDFMPLFQGLIREYLPDFVYQPIPLDEEFIFSLSRMVVHMLDQFGTLTTVDKQTLRNELHNKTTEYFSWESMILKYFKLLGL